MLAEQTLPPPPAEAVGRVFTLITTLPEAVFVQDAGAADVTLTNV